jgi:hypothetical protein
VLERTRHGSGDLPENYEPALGTTVEKQESKLASSLEAIDEDEVTPRRISGGHHDGDLGSSEQVHGSGGDPGGDLQLRHMSPGEQEPRPGDLDEPAPERRFGRRALIATLAIGTGVVAAIVWLALPDHDAGVPRMLIRGPAAAESPPPVVPAQAPADRPEAPVQPKQSPRAPASPHMTPPATQHRKQHNLRGEPDEPQGTHQFDPDSTLPPSIQ